MAMIMAGTAQDNDLSLSLKTRSLVQIFLRHKQTSPEYQQPSDYQKTLQICKQNLKKQKLFTEQDVLNLTHHWGSLKEPQQRAELFNLLVSIDESAKFADLKPLSLYRLLLMYGPKHTPDKMPAIYSHLLDTLEKAQKSSTKDTQLLLTYCEGILGGNPEQSIRDKTLTIIQKLKHQQNF